MSKLKQTLSVAFMGAFAGGCVLLSLVMVPDWRRMNPDAFLEWFSENGPKLGLTMFPMEVAGTLFASLSFVESVKRKSDSRVIWALSSLCMVATVVLLPLYFVGANARMLNKTIEASEVAAELDAWSRWHRLRTALAILAVVFGGWGLRRDETGNAPG
jgi:hypothetical protein